MKKKFGEAERYILGLFEKGMSFQWKDESFYVDFSGKPTCYKGEPKTDIYVRAVSEQRHYLELKISFKKANADFLENKMSAERAEEIFGETWMEDIQRATKGIAERFASRPLIYKTEGKRTQAGSITMGWKFEFVNKANGQLSGDMNLSMGQIVDIYAGTHLPQDKRDAQVGNRVIPDSGVANCFLIEDEEKPINTLQDAVNQLVDIRQYVQEHPHVYFACKALNYRSFAARYDGNRPLSVYVDWHCHNGKLGYRLCFDEPLIMKGNAAYRKLRQALQEVGARTTNDLNESNVENPAIILE